MKTTTITITLPDETYSFLEEQVTLGGFDSPSAFIEALLRQTQDRLESLLLEGLEGKRSEITEEWWQRLQAQ